MLKSFEPAPDMKPGDTIRIAGCYQKVPNPRRKWWSFWRPKMIDGPELQVWTCVDAAP